MVSVLTPEEIARLTAAPFTYAEVGATAERRTPAGFRGVHVVLDLEVPFERAVETLMTWRMHQGARTRVRASTPRVEPGSVVDLALGVGPLRIHAPCRVIGVHRGDAAGFTYGTLPGHPECGEERFSVVRRGSGAQLEVTAFSRPGRWFTRLAGPLGALAQDEMIELYRRALDHAE